MMEALASLSHGDDEGLTAFPRRAELREAPEAVLVPEGAAPAVGSGAAGGLDRPVVDDGTPALGGDDPRADV